MTTTTNTLLDAALSYASKGFKVFPLKPGDKLPITTHGVKDATQLQITVKEYWRKWPDANIGLSCDGLLVLDLDGYAGVETKNRLIEKYGELPHTWTIKTGGGTKEKPKEQGEHYVYSVPTDLNIRPGAGKYGYPGLDVRANDSYIVAAPSVTRLPYQTIDDSPVAPAPVWLIELSKTPTPLKITTTTTQGEVIPEGSRNSALASLAGSMRKRGMTLEAIEAALITTNMSQCAPPLPDGEVLNIARSVARYEPGQPGGNGHKPVENIKLPNMICIDTVTPETISWLWKPRIPLGKLTLLEGDPGCGKSWVAEAIATAVSLGASLPDSEPLPEGPVIIASAEDGLADTIRPRLDKMGARLSAIHVIDGLFTLDDVGFEMLERYISSIMPALVIIDPLVAYLSGTMDINQANQVRYATARLGKLAEKYYPAILAVRHLSKSRSLKPIYQGLGSIDFAASARSILLAGIDPETQERGIVQIKCSVAALGKAIGYDIREDGFFWLDNCELTAGKLLAPDNGDGGSPGNEAEAFILEILADSDAPASEIYNKAADRGISSSTLNRAKSKLRIITYKETGKGRAGKWYWKLPEN